MKTYNRKELPREIIIKDKTYLLNLDATKYFNSHNSPGLLKLEMATKNLFYCKVNVLPKKLRVRTDLTQKPYNPSVWIFTTGRN